MVRLSKASKHYLHASKFIRLRKRRNRKANASITILKSWQMAGRIYWY